MPNLFPFLCVHRWNMRIFEDKSFAIQGEFDTRIVKGASKHGMDNKSHLFVVMDAIAFSVVFIRPLPTHAETSYDYEQSFDCVLLYSLITLCPAPLISIRTSRAYKTWLNALSEIIQRAMPYDAVCFQNARQFVLFPPLTISFSHLSYSSSGGRSLFW